MEIHEVMTHGIVIASPDDTLQAAAKVMSDTHLGFLPVAENDRLVGMVSDRDITVRAVAHGLPPTQSTVRDVTSWDVKYVYEDESLEDAARNMRDLRVRRLPVLNRDKRLVGIVSLSDLAVNESELAGKALSSISH